MTLITRSRNTTFDLDPWVGQRHATFRFDLVDGSTGLELGEIRPDRGSPPTLTHDTTRTTKRTLSPLVLDEEQTAEIDSVAHRVRVSMIVAGETYPLGRYVFANVTRVRTTRGLRSSSALVDEMFIVDQKIETAFTCRTRVIDGTVQTNEVVETTVERLLFGLPVTFSVEPTPFGSIGAWPMGTNRGRVLDDLALDGDYFSPWFDHASELRMIRSFDPATRVPAFDWDEVDVVFRDSISETDDLTGAPNRIVVVSNAPGEVGTSRGPVIGTYDVPSSAPHSFLNRGFRVTDVRELQVASTAQAIAVAFNVGQRQTVFEHAEMNTPPDPRHDSYDVIRWQGDNWLELGWSLRLAEGSDMHHTLRKAYS